MSYCVNCGVELDKTCSACPLCQTPVLNPNQPVDTVSPKPYPTRKGKAEPVERREFTILMSIIFGTTALVCLLLNQFLFSVGNWSFYVTGICVLLWIALLPVFFPNTISAAWGLLFDGASIAAFLGMVSWLHPGNGWYLEIALPITLLSTIVVTTQYVISLRRKSSFIKKTALLFGNLGVLCAAIELLTDLHFERQVSLSWSAIVFTCCFTIDIVLITISHLKGVRAELRRRMHF